MVLTIDNAGALVPGVTAKEISMKMQRVKILRSFSDGKESLPKDSIQVLPMGLAVQAKDAHKVEFLPDEVKFEPSAFSREVVSESSQGTEGLSEIEESKSEIREQSKKSKKN